MRKYQFIIFLIPFLFACQGMQKKKMDERISLRRTDKNPYGTYVAYENMKYIFPDADIILNEESPAEYRSPLTDRGYFNDDSNRKSLFVIITPAFHPTQKEFKAIMRFVDAGNHVFVSSYSWDLAFTDSLNLKIHEPFTKVNFEDSLRLSVRHPVTFDSSSYAYPGKKDDTYFTQYDSNYSSVIGRDETTFPNLLRQTYTSGGSITVQSDPLAFSNFFLLHKNNNEYYDQVFSYFPQNVSTVIWDQYFRYKKNSDFNSLQVILNNKSLRTAFWLVLLLFSIIYLFESKRKQRIIPVISPLKNSSLDFVKTVGRLYYQYHDNKNLGMKMSAHLMEHIRQQYQLPTTTLDEKFVSALAFKSGYDKDKISSMIYQAKMINDFSDVSDEELLEFHRQTDSFYKHQ